VADVDGSEAELLFEMRPGAMVIVHVETPARLRGRGIGAALVREAVERARREGLVVLPQCPFAATWLIEHPEIAATVRPARGSGS
jgi:predicted GNAT family acetyltransferase